MALLITFIVISFLLFYLFTKSIKRSLINALILAPFLYMALNMMTQVAMTDDPQYLKAFSYMPNAIEGTVAGEVSKAFYAYRLSQIIIGGLVTSFAQYLTPQLSFIIYKVVHWIYCYIMIFSIIGIVYKYYLSEKIRQSTLKLQLSILILSIVMFALPVNHLMLKTSNYDGFTTYLTLIGLLLGFAGVKNGKSVIALIGVIFTVLASAEKNSSAPYYAITLMLYFYTVLKESQGLYKSKLLINIALKIIKVIVISIGVNILIFILQMAIIDGLTTSLSHLTISKVFFALCYYMYSATGVSINLDSFEMTNPWIYYGIIVIISLIAAIAFYLLSRYGNKNKKNIINANNCASWLPYTVGIIILIFLCVGIYSAYNIEFGFGNYKPMEDNLYIPSIGVNGTLVHYGAETKAEHFLSLISSHYATILNAIPTAFLVFFVIYIIGAFKKKYKNEDITQHLLLLGLLILPTIFAIFRFPGHVNRVYSISICGILLICTVIALNMLSETHSKIGTLIKKPIKIFISAVLYCILLLELIIYTPNVMPFTPLWNVFPKENALKPQYGYLRVAEPIFWGENVAVAGNMIKSIIGKNANPKEYKIVYDYGADIHWLANPGFSVFSYPRDKEVIQNMYNANTYFVLTRTIMFRKEIPTFLTEVEPIAKLSFRGTDALWIYRGDQLNKQEYRDYFS